MTEQDGTSPGGESETEGSPEDEAPDERADVEGTETDASDETGTAHETRASDAATDGQSETGDASEWSPKRLDDIEADLDAVESDVSDATELDDTQRRLRPYVEEADPETLARHLAAHRLRIRSLEDELAATSEEVEDLESKLKRKQADFQNFKKRMKKRREEEKERATEDLVSRLLDVRDNLHRALSQDENADIRDGVEATARELDRVLEEENVVSIEPGPGEEVDPARHEVLMQVESDHPEGTIADVHRPGYEMAEQVLREAQVTVSSGPSDSSSDDSSDSGSAEETGGEESPPGGG